MVNSYVTSIKNALIADYTGLDNSKRLQTRHAIMMEYGVCISFENVVELWPVNVHVT